MPSDRDYGDGGDRARDGGKEQQEDLRPPQRPRPQTQAEPRPAVDPDSFKEPGSGYRPAGGQPPVGESQAPPQTREQRRVEPSFGPEARDFRGAGQSPFEEDDHGDAGAWGDDDPYAEAMARPEPARAPIAPPARRRRVLPLLLALLLLVGFGAIAWYAYNWGLSGGQGGPVPVVTAENEAIKEQPEVGAEGGLEVPYQDTAVLNDAQPDLYKPEAERLLPPPEEPVEVPEAPAGVPAAPEPLAELPPPPPAPETAPSSGEVPLPEPPAVPAPVPAPAPEAAAPPAPEVAAPASPQTAEVPAAPAAPAPNNDLQVSAVPEGSYVVQLAAVRSQDAAQSEWARFQREHEAQLAGMPLLVQEIDIEGRGIFFRIQTGPFPNKATAQDICAQLKAAGQDCIVKRR